MYWNTFTFLNLFTSDLVSPSLVEVLSNALSFFSSFSFVTTGAFSSSLDVSSNTESIFVLFSSLTTGVSCVSCLFHCALFCSYVPLAPLLILCLTLQTYEYQTCVPGSNNPNPFLVPFFPFLSMHVPMKFSQFEYCCRPIFSSSSFSSSHIFPIASSMIR